MSIQKKLIEDILSSYNTILQNKDFIKEAATFVKLSSTGYSNVKYDNDGTQNDSVNKALLDDIQTAAKSVGIVATITTAKTGHSKNVKGSNNVSRHMNGTGIDVAILNGIGADGASNPTNGNANFRALGNKLRDALVSMGYTLNAEGSANPKAVLWQTNTGGNHFNHLHISNNSGVSSSQPTTSGDTQTSTGTETSTTGTETSTTGTEDYTGGAGKFARDIGGKILDVIGIKESFEPSSFGNNVQSNRGKILIPKKSNSKIKSPVSGVIVDINTSQSCINQTVIEFNEGYLEYCGITNPSLKTGDKVKVGNSLGTTNSNVTVTLFSRKKNKKDIELDDEKPKDSKPKNRDSLLVKGYHNLKKSSKEKEPETKSDNTKNSDYLLVRGYQKLKKSFDKTPDKKLDENIERIKGLLK